MPTPQKSQPGRVPIAINVTVGPNGRFIVRNAPSVARQSLPRTSSKPTTTKQPQ